MADSIAKQVVKILEDDLYLKRALVLGIANVSAIAKYIKAEHIPKASIHALKAGIRRYAESMEEYEASLGLKKLVSSTKLKMTSGIAVIHIAPRFKSLLKLEPLYNKASEFAVINSDNAITLIVDDKLVDEVIRTIGRLTILSIERDNSLITLTSPSKIESTPGFVAFVTDLMARHGINIREHYSCYTDTVLVLGKQDALKAYEILDSLND